MENLEKLIGIAPLVKVDGIYAKLETTNPSGSIKDIMAWYMIKKAEKEDKLKPGSKIIEVTSGNTGIAFAMISAVRGYKFIAVMPESMSIERRKIMKEYGAELVLTPAKEDMLGAVKVYDELIREYPDAWLPNQFENPLNIEAHKYYTGKEIIKQMNGSIDAFVAGVGTGGTLIGTALALKEVNQKVKIFAVEPAESAVLSGGKPGLHGIQGIGEGFIPKLVLDNLGVIDDVITIPTNKAIIASRNLAKKHGLLVGVSSGANLLAAQKNKDKYKRIVTIFPDRGERYLSNYQ